MNLPPDTPNLKNRKTPNNPDEPDRDSTFSIIYGYGSEDYSKWTPQGFHYEDKDEGTIYVPMWGYNPYAKPNPNKPTENVILVYRGIDNKTGQIKATERYFITAVTDAITERSPNSVFEIEAVGFRDNVLWFNANEWTNVNDTSSRFNGGIFIDSQMIK
jgi:hypothetical protein